MSQNNSIIIKNRNYPFLENIKYPKFMSYIPILKDDVYVCSITDIRVNKIENIQLKLILPEIKGKGSVACKKYYFYHLINYFEIFIKNPDDDEKILYSTDGENLLSFLLHNGKAEQLLKYNSGIYDEYCEEKTGIYDDDIIFPSREIVIPIENYLGSIRIFPETTIIFRFKLNNISNIITYDTIYKNKALEELENNYKKTDLNLKLEFVNTTLDEEEIMSYNIKRFVRQKKITGKNKSKYLNSSEFSNALGLAFKSKSGIFTKNNKFIINPGPKTKEKSIIKKFNKKILNDLLIVSPYDLTNDEFKKKLGFSPKCKFVEVVNNMIYFDDDKRTGCKVFIELIPDNCKLYYHTNILTFSRNFQIYNILNVSKLYKEIRGICYIEDDLKIIFDLNNLKHNINIEIVSIPVGIWSHENNTSTGDLRSLKSKESDFYYNNEFILGMDFLSKDKGYNNINIKAGRDILDVNFLETKLLCDKINLFKITECDENSYPNISLINSFHLNDFIKADPAINFNTFIFSIKWKYYDNNKPSNLYDIYSEIILYELVEIIYNHVEKIMKINYV